MDEIIEQPPNQLEEKPKKFVEFIGKFGIPAAILVGMSFIAVSIYVSFGIPNAKIAGQTAATGTSPKEDIKLAAVTADDDAFLGNADAPVTMIEFSDFQCPFCRKLWKEVLPQLKKDYIDTGKVKFVYRDFPLSSIHEMAQPSAEAAECADEQGKFWEMHDKLFAEQEKKGQGTIAYTIDDLKKWAGQIGLNTAQFNDCLDTGKYKSEVEKDLADGAASGVQGTPASFINGQLVGGVQPYDNFKKIIEEILAKK